MQLASRWLAVLVCAALTTSAQVAEAQERGPGSGDVTSKISIYSDDDETTVVTSAVDADVVAPGNTAIGAYALIDAVSSASVDVISAATGRWTENRIEGGVRAGFDLNRITGVNVGYSTSRENDWMSHTFQASGRREFGNRNTEVAAGYALVLNTVGRADDPAFEESLTVHSLQLAASQLWSERTLFALTYNLQRASGFQSSPYRFADVAGVVMAPEAHPGTRLRHAWTGRHLRALGDAMSVESTYRFYFDDWGIKAHTLTSALTLEAATWVDVRARVRGYYQSGADFYQDGYDELRMFVSGDRELSQFWNIGGGIKGAFYAGPFTIDVKLDAIHYRFSEFQRLPRRNALIVGAGAKLKW